VSLREHRMRVKIVCRIVKLPLTNIQKILIIKPSSLGDIVNALPAVGAIRRQFQGARITWLVKSEWASILTGHPFIDEVLAVPMTWRGLPRLIRSVHRRPFDLVVDLQGLFRSAVLGWLTRSCLRVGFSQAREGAPWLYTDRVTTDLSHAVDRYRQIAAALGAKIDPVHFGLLQTGSATEEIDRFMKQTGISVPYAVIHPTARWESKQWPPERFARIGDGLLQDKATVVFTGSRSDYNAIQHILSSMKYRAINGAGQLSLPGLVELIRRARLFIGNDSGPMHIAASVGTPVLALFGPTDPKKVGPYGAGHIVIQKRSDCIGCHRSLCAHQNRCMKAIQVEEVQRAIEVLWPSISG